MERERCFGGHDEEVAENCVAVCSSAVESSEGGIEEGYPGLPEVAAVCGCSAVVHFSDVHSACVENCSLKFAEMNFEMLQHVVVGPSAVEVQGSALFAVDCSAYAESHWVERDRWSCCYLCWDGM